MLIIKRFLHFGLALFPVAAILFLTACAPKIHNQKEPGAAMSVDSTYAKVEVESAYPGGRDGWMRYLIKTFRYPMEAQQARIQGDVVVQFIVGKDGKVSGISAVAGPERGGLREEAIRVVRGSGKWMPAIQNGKPVKSYKKQAISFRIE